MACALNELKDKSKPRFVELLINTSAGLLHASRELIKLSGGDLKVGADESASILGDAKEQKDALRNGVKMSVHLLAATATAAEKAHKTSAAVKKKTTRIKVSSY